MFDRLRLGYLARQFARPGGWTGRWLIGPWLDRIGGPMNRLALARLDIRPGERVLELGFGGGGLLASALAVAGTEVTGIDISSAMVARARRRFRGEIARGRLHIFQASAEDLPLPESRIDKACSLNSLYFWPHPAAAMAEFARVVRPGGRLAICFEPPEELAKWRGHRLGFRIFAADEVVELMQGAGFANIEAVFGTGRKPDRFLCLSGTRSDANASS